MELFEKAVRLKSHLDKYLVADDDQETTRQSRNGNARRSRWLVEIVHGSNDLIRLKSCHGRYLTASNDHFLLGMTGKKVNQSMPQNTTDLKTIWKPIKDGFQVKLMAYDGSFLRANGGTPPWRNSITHDVPQAISSTNNWILWDAEAVEVPENEGLADYLSLVSGLSSVSDELSSLELGSPMSVYDSPSPSIAKDKDEGMYTAQRLGKFLPEYMAGLQSHISAMNNTVF